MLRLEHENKMLRMRNSGSEEEGSHVLQSMLDDANSRKNELETEIRSAENAFISLSICIGHFNHAEDILYLHETGVLHFFCKSGYFHQLQVIRNYVEY